MFLIERNPTVANGDEPFMPQSLVKILVHVVFSTKERVRIIEPEIESSLFGYIHGIVENNGSKLIIANGDADHVHLLISLGRKIDISELIGDIKRDSSSWIKKKEVDTGISTGSEAMVRSPSVNLKSGRL